MAILFAEQIQRFSDQTIVLRPLPTARPIVANAMRRFDQAKYLFAQFGGGQSFQPVIDGEPEDGQEFYKGGASLWKLDISAQLDPAIAAGFARYVESEQPAVVGELAAKEIDVPRHAAQACRPDPARFDVRVGLRPLQS